MNNPNRIAWLTLVSGFVVFCLVCAGTVYGIQWFVFESNVNLTVTARVAQRTIIISSPDNVNPVAVTTETTLAPGDRVITDEGSQASISFTDSPNDGKVLSTVQVMPGSRVRLKQTSQPRFGLGDNPYILQLDDVRGSIYITVSRQLERDIRIEVSDIHNRRLRLDKGGYYLLEVTDDTFSVTVRAGEAVLVTDRQETKLIQREENGQIDGTGTLQIAPERVVYLNPNSLLEDHIPHSEEEDAAGWPETWACTRERPDIESEPRGNHQYGFFQDRLTMRLVRAGHDLHNAEARCEQNLPNIDVSDYESLRLRVTMYLVDHDISACGAVGTECVLMIRLGFYNQIDTGEWIQGFYITYDPARGGETRCQSCVNEHIHVNGGTWYTFESEDFVRDLPAERSNLRPMVITGIEFYSSGHSYDAYVSEVTLIGEDFDP
ncbi:MAG: FecR family protein [Chloroflexi bacterium]|nr:FecR family protein [Chloroflexota bacterium]